MDRTVRAPKISSLSLDQKSQRGVVEIARNSVESKRPSELIDYATLTPFAIDLLETAFAIDDSSIGMWR